MQSADPGGAFSPMMIVQYPEGETLKFETKCYLYFRVLVVALKFFQQAIQTPTPRSWFWQLRVLYFSRGPFSIIQNFGLIDADFDFWLS